jgi:tRNA pseudouridine55 synthase
MAERLTNIPNTQGVLAVNKPPKLTSADVVRFLQNTFNKSDLFSTHLDEIRKARRAEPVTKSTKRRDKKPLQVKIGHGGTLDPMATGVLIVGIGDGTKSLNEFQNGGTKTYETIVLFGADTDTYDVTGNVISAAPTEGVTKEKIEAALQQFRGEYKQVPPAFSAKRVNGERLYDLARQGKEITKDMLKEKEVNVTELELMDFYEAGQHEYTIKTQKREEFKTRGHRIGKRRQDFDDQDDARKKSEKEAKQKPDNSLFERGSTPKVTGNEAEANIDTVKERALSDIKEAVEKEAVQVLAVPETSTIMSTEADNPASPKDTTPPPPPYTLGPAVRLRMTVTSGFYVRSLAHDLGVALGSAGTMAELIRTKQSQFELGKNVIEYTDVEGNEETWGPKVQRLLKDWQSGKP